MSIYAEKREGRPTGRWTVEVERDGKRARGRFATLEEAQKAETEWKAGRMPEKTSPVSGATVEAPKTLGELVAKVSKFMWRQTTDEKGALSQIEAFLAHAGDLKLADLKTEHIDAFIETSMETREGGTTNRYLSRIHKMLAWGAARGYLTMPTIQWQEEGEGRIRWLTVDEETYLLQLLRSYGRPDVADLVEVAILTGMRRSELLSLTRQQLDGNWCRLWRTKNGEARSVPLSERARAILEERVPFDIPIYTLRHFWGRARTEMALAQDPWFTFHVTRHSCATRLVQRNVNLRVIQKYLGHRSIETTLRYAQVSDDLLTNAAAALAGEGLTQTPVLVSVSPSPQIRGELVQTEGEAA